MLVHPWDEGDDDEWRAFLADGRDFGQLVVAGLEGWPLVLPAPFLFDGDREVLMHLARPNPAWPAIEASPRVVLSVLDDYANVPTTWRAPEGQDGVPTSYYASVQLRCEAEVVDDPHEKAELLRRQLAATQPDIPAAAVAVGEPPYGRLLSGIRGLRLQVVEVVAKFKYDDQKSAEHRTRIAGHLAERGKGRDPGARAQQLRRLERRPPG